MALAAVPSSAWAKTASIRPVPNTYSTCNVGTYATLCFLVTGTGDFVGYMQDNVTWNGTHSNTHLEISGPSGTWNSGVYTNATYFRKPINMTVVPGSYCEPPGTIQVADTGSRLTHA